MCLGAKMFKDMVPGAPGASLSQYRQCWGWQSQGRGGQAIGGRTEGGVNSWCGVEPLKHVKHLFIIMITSQFFSYESILIHDQPFSKPKFFM